jgi:hypothetical protein
MLDNFATKLGHVKTKEMAFLLETETGDMWREAS